VRHKSYRLAVLTISAVALVAVSGCGSKQSASRADVPAFKVSERDFRISAPKHARAGRLTLSVRNRGPVAHELILVRAERPRLPFRADGFTVDEEALEDVTAGALEPGQPGKDRRLDVHLRPGRYVLFCNMAGHYLAGMHRKLTVR
jgi:uncharacterized cupredoxin-like copper-binding protein